MSDKKGIFDKFRNALEDDPEGIITEEAEDSIGVSEKEPKLQCKSPSEEKCKACPASVANDGECPGYEEPPASGVGPFRAELVDKASGKVLGSCTFVPTGSDAELVIYDESGKAVSRPTKRPFPIPIDGGQYPGK